jgi:DNA-binding MarR family transcriptional regulator
MNGVKDKEKELMDYLDVIVHRIMLTQEQTVYMCTKREMRIIEILGKRGLLMMTEVAELSTLSLSTVTGIIDSLVAKSLVSRVRSDADRRVVRVELTSEGRKMYDLSVEFRLKLVRSMLTSLNKGEQDQFMALFRKIAEKVQSAAAASIA